MQKIFKCVYLICRNSCSEKWNTKTGGFASAKMSCEFSYFGIDWKYDDPLQIFVILDKQINILNHFCGDTLHIFQSN